MEKKNIIPLKLNLQYFADDTVEENDDIAEENNDDKDNGETGKDNKHDTKQEKTFTQSQVNRLMSREKKEGRTALLNTLGFKTEEEAQKAVQLYTALMNSQKSETEKNDEVKNNAIEAQTAAEKRAIEAENKLACIMAGVNKESVADVLAIASLKVDENNNLDSVLAEMRKQARYAVFFDEAVENDKSKDTGTGHDTAHGKKGGENKKGAYGARLGSQSNKSNKKNTFFE
jgi:hypothetical protein